MSKHLTRTVLSVLMLCSLLITGWRVGSLHSLIGQTSAQTSTPAVSNGVSTDNSCNVGNNTALRFGDAGINYDEAPTLAILNMDFSNQQQVIDIINNSNQTVVVRYGAAKIQPEQATFDSGIALGNSLAAIANATGKNFIATGGHNEPNCAEFVPLENEINFMQGVASVVGNSNQITLITGQIDIICGDASLGDKWVYLSQVSNIPGIDGVALPFYTVDGNKDAMLDLFTQAQSVIGGKPIYITESGPFKAGSAEPSEEEFRSFVEGMAQVIPQAELTLLFNAFGLNTFAEASGNAYNYTVRFWDPSCRAAFRSSCQDIDAVVDACGGGSSGKSDYYLFPIQGLTPNEILSPKAQTTTDPLTAISTDLVMQGYEARCYAPAYEFGAGLNGNREAYLSLFGETNSTFVFNSELNYDTSDATVPILRGATNETLFSSLESYLGYVNPDAEPDSQESLLSSAPIARMVDQQQHCQIKVGLLKTIDRLCKKYQDSASCALYKDIPGTETNTRDLITKLGLSSNRPSKELCEEMLDPNYDETVYGGATYDDLYAMPFHINNTYRLAFLVLVAEQKTGPKFSFLALSENGATENDFEHEVRIIAFKVPDFTTNRNWEDPDLEFHGDGLVFTQQSILSQTAQEKKRETYVNQRRELLDAVIPGRGEGQLNIACGGANCNQPLVRSLVNLVNAREQFVCDPNPVSLKYEEASKINTSASLPEPGSDGSASNLQNVVPTVDGLANNQVFQSLTNLRFNFLSEFNAAVEGPDNSKIRGYLVIPQGVELEDAQDTLAGYFMTKDQKQQFLAQYTGDSDDTPAFFKLNGITESFNTTDNPTTCFTEAGIIDCQGALDNAETSDQVYDVKPGITLSSQGDFSPRILGAALGGVVRGLQTSLHNIYSKPHEYLSSCETTEQFLTMSCGSADTFSTAGTTPGDSSTGDSGYVPGTNQSPPAVAQCRLADTGAITSGETAQHVISPNNSECMMYEPDLHNIPDWKQAYKISNVTEYCENFESYAACTYPDSLIGNTYIAGNTLYNRFQDSGESPTACEYLVNRAMELNQNPYLFLAMWGEESGFNSPNEYVGGYVAGLGATTKQFEADDLESQITAMSGDINNASTYLAFIGKWSEGSSRAPGGEFCRNKYFPARLKTYYDYTKNKSFN